MATYYWRGGTATWGTGQNANWSINGAAPAYGFYNPGAGDDVVFDATSGTCTVTINGARSIGTLTMTGFTGILTGTGQGSIAINGSTCTLSASGSFAPANYPALIFGGNCTLTSNGQTIGHITVQSGSLSLADNLQTNNNSVLYLLSGTFYGNGRSVAVGYFTDASTTNFKTLNMGGGKWTVMADGPVAAIGASTGPESVWNVLQPTYTSIAPNNSTINFLRAKYVSTLASTINSGASSIALRDTVTDNAGNSAWPTAGTISIEGYSITYTGKSGNTLTGVSGVTTTFSAGTQVFSVQPKTTTLTTAIANGTDTTTIVVGDNTPFGNEGFIQIDDEVISYTGKSGTTGFTGITRSTAYGISGTAHSSGAVVRPVEGITINTGGQSITYDVISVGHVQYATVNGLTLAGSGATLRGSINGKVSLTASNGTTVTYLSPTVTAVSPGGAVITAPSSIDEGSAGSFSVSTLGITNGTTLYWTINNTTTSSGDFSATSGSFSVTGNSIDGATGSYSITPTADTTTEGSETFTSSVRITSTSGTVIGTSSSVTVNDTSLSPPTYAFSTIPSSINEGSAGTFNVTTTNVANGTTLYWTINNTTTSSGDFSATSGSFNITSNAGSFTVTPTADTTTEGSETFTVSIRTGSTSGTVVATSSSVTVNDTSTTPITYAFTSPWSTTTNEGSSATFYVSCTGIASGTTLYWTLFLAGSATSADFSAISGSFTVTGSYASTTGSFTVTPIADLTTEPDYEGFYVQLRTGSTSGTIVATTVSDPTLINDTSQTPISYAFGTIPTSINEGSAGTFNVNCTGLASGTTLYWTIATNSGDFGTTSGSFTVTGNYASTTGSFTVTPTADSLTEGAETFTVALRTGSTSGTVVATSSSVTINDTSIASTTEDFFPFFVEA